jgi:glycosyltransferase involved in cell wall biosynthesis
MLVKDQQQRITDVIDKLLPFCHQLIIVDTGSTDQTVEKIQQLHNAKISLHFKNWVENFAEMRNYIIDLNKNDWLIFIDSDEYLCDKHLSPQTFKAMLALMSVLSQNDNIALQLKIKKPCQNSYTLAERGLKKESTVKYYNKIHESLKATPIKYFKLDVTVENHGTNPEEMIRFNKKTRYEKLVKEILLESPDNIKMLLNYPFPDGNLEKSQEYLTLINQIILKDISLGWQKDNFLLIDDFPTLTQKYILVLISIKKLKEVIHKTNLLLRINPADNFLLAMNYFAEWSLVQETLTSKLSEFLQWYNEIDTQTSLEETLMPKDFSVAIAIKYLVSLQEFEKATRLLDEVTDITAKSLIQTEIKILEREADA